MPSTKKFALIDCNNFYVSCERLFNPCLRQRPVVVLSNNDGCIIARSNEAKNLGIGMGEPYFKKKQFLRQHGVQIFSSNYALYGDLSQRVMTILQQEEPEMEIYSIDEAFVRLLPVAGKSMAEHGRYLKKRVDQCVGVPVSVGIGTSKTLAKLASGIAKKDPACQGVFDLAACPDQDTVLAGIPVNAVWGIGRRSAKKLNRHGIYTALELKSSDSRWIRGQLGLPGLRTVTELRGKACISIEQSPPNRKSVVSSRSFRQPLTTIADLQEAISCYVSIAARKIRSQGLLTANLHVFLSCNRFANNNSIPCFSGSRMLPLAEPTACTPTLIKAALRGLRQLYRPGHAYKKAGVMLTGLSDAAMLQQNLFFRSAEVESRPLMAALDRVNSRWGSDTLRYGSSGTTRKWSMKQDRKSPAYTTCWAELPVVYAAG
jgi:DNA polymerase V